MTLTGHHFIAGKALAPAGELFKATNPSTSQPLEPSFGEGTAHVEEALQAADAAFDALRLAPVEARARFLDALAEEILALGDALLERAHAETALPMARLTAERGRAMNQCKMFAALIRDGSWASLRIDHAIADRQPLPKPDVRQMLQPLGPVVVFGASNFPFAIGVVGTDTVCALAAGCPVVVKGHPAHPGTCEMLAGAVHVALAKAGLPAGAFSLLHGKSNDIGIALVRQPLARAVAFTGSLRGGRALMDVAAARPEPIPFYGEMGSVNPVFVLPGALRERAAKTAEAYLQSVNMSVSQFCTNTAVVLGLKSPELETFIQGVAEGVAKIAPATMLHRGICDAYDSGVGAWREISSLRLVGKSEAVPSAQATQAACQIFATGIADFEAHPELHRVVFGQCSIITECGSMDDLLRFARNLEGQLTAAIHGTADDLREFAPLVRILERKVGRIIFNGFGTGIEPCPSMHHGGPYPAASHSFFTSIGTASIYRFVRPVCYQGFPDDCLPEPLREANPAGALRLVDGKFQTA